MLVPTWIITVVFFLASIRKILDQQYEHAVTRLFLAGAYLHIGYGLPIEHARELSRWFILLLGTIEITSWMFRKWVKKDG